MNKELIARIIHTLNHIEVRGKNNLDKLLGCINALESVMQSIETEEEKNG